MDTPSKTTNKLTLKITTNASTMHAGMSGVLSFEYVP